MNAETVKDILKESPLNKDPNIKMDEANEESEINYILTEGLKEHN